MLGEEARHRRVAQLLEGATPVALRGAGGDDLANPALVGSARLAVDPLEGRDGVACLDTQAGCQLRDLGGEKGPAQIDPDLGKLALLEAGLPAHRGAIPGLVHPDRANRGVRRCIPGDCEDGDAPAAGGALLDLARRLGRKGKAGEESVADLDAVPGSRLLERVDDRGRAAAADVGEAALHPDPRRLEVDPDRDLQDPAVSREGLPPGPVLRLHLQDRLAVTQAQGGGVDDDLDGIRVGLGNPTRQRISRIGSLEEELLSLLVAQTDRDLADARLRIGHAECQGGPVAADQQRLRCLDGGRGALAAQPDPASRRRQQQDQQDEPPGPSRYHPPLVRDPTQSTRPPIAH